MANHSSILAWKISRIEEPGGLQSMGLQRVGHDWVTSATNMLTTFRLYYVFFKFHLFRVLTGVRIIHFCHIYDIKLRNTWAFPGNWKNREEGRREWNYGTAIQQNSINLSKKNVISFFIVKLIDFSPLLRLRLWVYILTSKVQTAHSFILLDSPGRWTDWLRVSNRNEQ